MLHMFESKNCCTAACRVKIMDPQGAMYVYATINHGGRSYTDKRTKFSNTLM